MSRVGTLAGLLAAAAVVAGLAGLMPAPEDPRLDGGTWVVDDVYRDNKSADSPEFARCVRLDDVDGHVVEVVLAAGELDRLDGRLAVAAELTIPCPSGPLRT